MLFIGRGETSSLVVNLSIFSSASPCQQKSWFGIYLLSVVLVPSVVRRPCRNYLRTYHVDFFQTPVVACPGPYVQTFLEFKKGFYNRTLWEQKLQTLTLESLLMFFFQTSPESSSYWYSQKYCFWIFDILTSRFFMIFVEEISLSQSFYYLEKE